MGSMEEHSGGNQLRYLWRSPRGTVLGIEALALVAITLSFFLAFFGSCRRWSNRWIVQKGFWAAQVLSLSLGTYSIGLMQSSPVKSEMYPIWAVSLLTLFGCVDPVTTYIGLDYKGPLSKMIFQLCLYFGYVMLMSVSTISSDVVKLAVVLLSTITIIKGFHTALAFVVPADIQENITKVEATEAAALAGDGETLKVHYSSLSFGDDLATMGDIQKLSLLKDTPINGMTIKDVCLSYSFSHLLRLRFLGTMHYYWEMKEKVMDFERLVCEGRLTTADYKRAMKVVEVELGFLFEAFFSSNEFLHLYQAKTGSIWALASFFGICFVGVVVAIIHGPLASHHSIIHSIAATGDPGAGTSVAINIVGTTIADLVITLVILVSLALLQLVQLIRCWTSYWATVGIACEYAIREKKKQMSPEEGDGPNDDPQRRYKEESKTRSSYNQIISRWVMGLRLFLVARVNWFDKYLWQGKLGQDSLAALLQREHSVVPCLVGTCCCCPSLCISMLFGMLFGSGVRYFIVVLMALFFRDSTNSGGNVRLHDDVKASIAKFLGTIKSRRIGVEWSALFVENGLEDWLEYLPYFETEAFTFTRRVMVWHIATWYCEEAEKAVGGGGGGEDSSNNREKNRRVAIDLSKYFVYLVVSAPELLPGPAEDTALALQRAQRQTKEALSRENSTITMLQAMQQLCGVDDDDVCVSGVYLGKRLCGDAMTTPPAPPPPPQGGNGEEAGEQSTRRPCSTDHWELLALLWVQTLLYTAPYGDVQAHLQRLAKGGEFITHIWALLFHLGIDKWEVECIMSKRLKALEAKTATLEEGLAAMEAKTARTEASVEAALALAEGLAAVKARRARAKQASVKAVVALAEEVKAAKASVEATAATSTEVAAATAALQVKEDAMSGGLEIEERN